MRLNSGAGGTKDRNLRTEMDVDCKSAVSMIIIILILSSPP
jgi:hypothetical protein